MLSKIEKIRSEICSFDGFVTEVFGASFSEESSKLFREIMVYAAVLGHVTAKRGPSKKLQSLEERISFMKETQVWRNDLMRTCNLLFSEQARNKESVLSFYEKVARLYITLVPTVMSLPKMKVGICNYMDLPETSVLVAADSFFEKIFSYRESLLSKMSR